MKARPFLLLAVLLVSPACGLLEPFTKNQEMLSVAAQSPAEQRWALLRRTLGKEGWRIESSDPAKEELVAVRPDEGLPDLRERLVAHLTTLQSAVLVQSEIRSGDQWKSTPVVCRSYSYAREKQILASMEDAPAGKSADSSGQAISMQGPQER